MSNFEKIGVIFVTGLVAVILAMSFFGTGHPLPEEGEDRAAADATERSTPDNGEHVNVSRGSIVSASGVDERDARPSWGSMGSRSSAQLEERREATKRSLAGDTQSTPDAQVLPGESTPRASKPRAERFASAPPSTFDSGTGASNAGAPSSSNDARTDDAAERRLADAAKNSSSGAIANAAATMQNLWDMTRKIPPVGERAEPESAKPTTSGIDRAIAATTPSTVPTSVPTKVADPGRGTENVPNREASANDAVAKTRTYEIKPMDTLSEIAQRELGTSQALPKLLEANPGLDPRRLIVGAEICIPVEGGTGGATIAPERSSGTPKARIYEVRPMDTLSGIAQSELGSSKAWRQLVEANPGIDPNRLRVGMKIRIPGSESAPKAPSRKTDDASRIAKSETSRDAELQVDTRFYLVGAGETLTEIAQAELGTTKRWKELYELNRDRLASADRLIAGQRLRLPE